MLFICLLCIYFKPFSIQFKGLIKLTVPNLGQAVTERSRGVQVILMRHVISPSLTLNCPFK